MNPSTIVLATDMSANAAFAARWARSYSELTGARVVAVQILEISVPNWLRDAHGALEDPERRSALHGKVRSWYATHTDGAQLDDVVVESGNIDEEIGRIAKAQGATLIVMAKSGKSALTKFLAGSTAQMLAAQPPLPVVFVHPDHARLTRDTSLAVATDLTITAERALVAGALLAKAAGTSLAIVHAASIELPAGMEELPESMRPNNLDAAARVQFDKVIAAHDDDLSDVDYSTHIIHSSPVEAVQGFVEERDTDIVLLGNAKEYSLITNMFRRVSVKLMQTLPSTVIVVPPEADLPDFDELAHAAPEE
jgi:nucleotide-binding universal stress UspA family protein